MKRAREIQTEGLQDLRRQVLDLKAIRCPFFEEVLVAFCRAFPVRKMIPSDRLNTTCVCTHEGFEDCMLFREVMAKLESGKPAGDPDEAKAVTEPGSSTG
jgi:hypothetical protein